MPTYAVTFLASVCIGVKARSKRKAIEKVYAMDSDDVMEIDPEPSITPVSSEKQFAQVVKV